MVVTIQVVNQDNEVVDHRGFTPRKDKVGIQECRTQLSSHDEILEANKMMNTMYACAEIFREAREIT